MSMSLFFILREREKEWDREGEKHHCVKETPQPDTGPQQPRHVAQKGIKPVTFHLAEWHPTNWATSDGAVWACLDQILK